MRKLISCTVLLLQIVNVFGSVISEQKCSEYRNGVGRLDDDAKKYSFMVRVFIGNDDDYRNGVLISESFVLTSGIWPSSELARIEFGFLHADENRTQSIAISETIRYPTGTTLCLLKLNQSINQFNEFIRPICLSNGPIIVTGMHSEVSTSNRLHMREILITGETVSGSVGLLHTSGGCRKEEPKDSAMDRQTYAGSVLLNEDDEMAGIKQSFGYGGCPDEFYTIQRCLGWIEQNVWPIPKKMPTVPNTGMRIGSISFTVVAVVFIRAFLY